MTQPDRTTRTDIHFAVNEFGTLCLEVGKYDMAAVVLVQHKTFSVMCSVEGDTVKLDPITCPLPPYPNFTMDTLINDRRSYIKRNEFHTSDRDGHYTVHTYVSNQVAEENSW